MIKKYYKNLSILRVFSCIAILFYHLGIIKGGFLAVCTFFTLTGYLATTSILKEDKFSISNYYINRFKKIYLPLLIVVLITVFIIPIITNFNWINLKPETRSIILGYNNYWQLSANLDYFSRNINSPFTHLWFIGILLQIELILPAIILLLKKVSEKTNKLISCIIIFMLAVISTKYFYDMSLQNNLMQTYYDTLSRSFSIIYGVLLGFIHIYYKPLSIFKNDKAKQILICIYLTILTSLFFIIDFKSQYFNISMIIVSIITMRIIDNSIFNNEQNKFDKIIKMLSNISYEIYLIQYPIIFYFQYNNVKTFYSVPIIIILTIILSCLLHISINYKEKNKINYTRLILLMIFLVLSLGGIHQYIITKDHTKEFKDLEYQMTQNEKDVEKRQKEYEKKLLEEKESWKQTLENLEKDESKIKDNIKKQHVVGIGDSVMLGAADKLYETFSNGYFDAKISRSTWAAQSILADLNERNLLGEPIIIGLGANGDCPGWVKEEIMKIIGNRKVFWINVTNDDEVDVNTDLKNATELYDNLYLVDWNSASLGHPEYFYADGIHLTEIGIEKYIETILDKIEEVYKEDYNKKKEEIIDNHEKEEQQKISFYGNDLLLNSFDYVKKYYKKSSFNIDSEYTYNKLMKELKREIENNTLDHNLVFAFDSTFKISDDEYDKLIELCGDRKIYIVKIDDRKINNDKVSIINFYKEIEKNKKYIMVDKIHLTDLGNQKLSETINNIVREEVN